MTTTPHGTKPPRSRSRALVDVLRGALIGTAETVPGVSGGTVALVVGVYDTAITSAGHLISGVRRTVTDGLRGRGMERAALEFRAVHWRVIVPMLIGMVAALLLMARLMGGWVEDHPVQTSALFFGLVLASLWVPFSLSVRGSAEQGAEHGAEQGADGKGRWGLPEIAAAVVTAALAFIVVSLPPGDVDATPPVLLVAAALAVSGLVLPGLSGSFLLLTFGLYQSTLTAVNDRDLGYLGLFALGALVGLASIVKLLQWLLTRWHRMTLVVLTGLMAGSLRALWPWQDDDRNLLAPGEHVGTAAALAGLGVVVVVVALVSEHRMRTRASSAVESGTELRDAGRR
ncbi:DUF368 domain-containing protein [Saccharomonospora piscinae]|uniref:DUF368 domain-containing protein n=1 Tax=Saccharomonospora piscinae TaxID=687388 RepID=UPI001FC9C75E|nr:DUF368 domain-containing protein [Saccharomonospora piscinae]